MTMQAPLPKVWHLAEPKDEEEVAKRAREHSYADFTATRQQFRDKLTDWNRNAQRRLATYQANEPVFIVADDNLLAYWFELREQPGPTVAPPELVAQVVSYWITQQPVEPPMPSLDPLTGMPQNPAEAMAYQEAYTAFQTAHTAWAGRMLRFADHFLLPGDLLAPWWRDIYEWRPKLGEAQIKDYAQLGRAKQRRTERNGASNGENFPPSANGNGARYKEPA